MPREKKNGNQNNRGTAGKGPSKKKDPSKEQCYYGKACKRKDCIYKHDNEGRTGKGGKADERSGPREPDNLMGEAAFPPLSGTNGTTPRPMALAGAWGASPPSGAPATSSTAPSKQVPQQTASPQTVTNTAAVAATAAAAPVKSAWMPAPPPQPAPVWGSGINPVLANHSTPPPAPVMAGSAAAQVTPNRQPSAPPAVTVPQQRLSDSALNINAKEFIPGNL